MFAKSMIFIFPVQEGLELPGGRGGGSMRLKNLKKCMKFICNFQMGVSTQNSFHGTVMDIF